MNFIEALRSGREFRRIAWANLGEWRKAVADHPRDSYIRVEKEEDLLADDWEVRPEPVAITRDDFWKAWDKVHRRLDEETETYGAPLEVSDALNMTLTELGLK